MSMAFPRPAAAVLIALTALASHGAATPQIAQESEQHVIAGSVTDSQGRPPSGVVIQVGAINPNGSVSLSSTPLAADGRFQTQPNRPLRGARGPYVVRCGYGLAPGTRWWPSQVLLDGRDITNVPTDFGDAENRQLEVLFTDHPSRLTGTVSDANGHPVPSAQVVLFSADTALWRRWATTSRGVMADTKGMFTVALQPGRYLARALPPIAPLAGAPHRIPVRWDFQ